MRKESREREMREQKCKGCQTFGGVWQRFAATSMSQRREMSTTRFKSAIITPSVDKITKSSPHNSARLDTGYKLTTKELR